MPNVTRLLPPAERVLTASARDVRTGHSTHIDRASRWQARGQGGLQRAACYHRAVRVFDGRGHLAKCLGAGDGPDANDGVGVVAQPVLVPHGGCRLGHTSQVLDADAKARVPGDEVAVGVPLPKLGGALGSVARVGSDEWDPGGPCAGCRLGGSVEGLDGLRCGCHGLGRGWLEGNRGLLVDSAVAQGGEMTGISCRKMSCGGHVPDL